jgi:hypothetical protein
MPGNGFASFEVQDSGTSYENIPTSPLFKIKKVCHSPPGSVLTGLFRLCGFCRFAGLALLRDEQSQS